MDSSDTDAIITDTQDIFVKALLPYGTSIVSLRRSTCLDHAHMLSVQDT